MMLGMLVNTSVPWTPNTWKIWVDHIMKHKKDFAFKKACMVYTNGNPAATSAASFTLPVTEILKIKQHFDPNCPQDVLSLNGKTFIKKSLHPNQLIVFNGTKYYIISKSKTMYIIVLCESRSKCDLGAAWLRRVVERLIEKDF